MKLRIALLGTMLVLMASIVSAFPLVGGNGVMNATVLGTYTVHHDRSDLTDVKVDVMFDYSGVTGGDFYYLKTHLVDSEDVFYEGDPEETIGGGQSSIGKSRVLFSFDVPSGKSIEIKRLRITPRDGSPFSIDWAGVPEVDGVPISMKFYSIGRDSGYGHSYELDILSADIKVTNIAQTEQTICGDQFFIVDQFGFSYEGSGAKVTLLPEESMRFNVAFGGVSKLSRPVYLKYAPSNLTMDISAWV